MTAITMNPTAEAPVKRKPGRPKGSKNRPKVMPAESSTTGATASESRQKRTYTRHARPTVMVDVSMTERIKAILAENAALKAEVEQLRSGWETLEQALAPAKRRGRPRRIAA